MQKFETSRNLRQAWTEGEYTTRRLGANAAPSLKKDNRRAFSLIEVVLAIGVVSFALLAVVALLPQGLLAVQNAETLQATSNIATQLRGQMQLLSFSSSSADAIQSLPTTTYYYTTDGIQTNVTSGYYRATFSVSSIAPTTSPVADINFNANNAENVVVTLTYPPAAWNQTNIFSLLVARITDN